MLILTVLILTVLILTPLILTCGRAGATITGCRYLGEIIASFVRDS